MGICYNLARKLSRKSSIEPIFSFNFHEKTHSIHHPSFDPIESEDINRYDFTIERYIYAYCVLKESYGYQETENVFSHRFWMDMDMLDIGVSVELKFRDSVGDGYDDLQPH